MNWKVILLGAIVVALLGAFLMYGLGISFGRGLQGFQNPPPTMNQFTMYYADWCPHCQSVKPEFEELAKIGIHDIGEKRCYVRMVNADKSPEEVKAKKIQGFPTFLLETTDGETVEYAGSRNTDGYLAFLNEKLGGK